MDFVVSFFKKSKDKISEPKKQMETDSPIKSINLFDKDISMLENSVLRPSRSDEIRDFDESNSENHEIKPKARFSVIKTLDPLLNESHADIETSDKFDDFECFYPSSNNNFAHSLVEEYLDTALNEVQSHEVPVASDCLVNLLINNVPINTAAKSEWNTPNETVLNVNNSLNQLEISQQSSGSDQGNKNNLDTTIGADLITSLKRLRIFSDTSVHEQSENIFEENIRQSHRDTTKVFNQSDEFLNEIAAHQLLNISPGVAAEDHFNVTTDDSCFEHSICQASSTLNEVSVTPSTIRQVLNETSELNSTSPSFNTTVIQVPNSSNETLQLNEVDIQFAPLEIDNNCVQTPIQLNLTTSETNNEQISKQLESNFRVEDKHIRAPIALAETIELEHTTTSKTDNIVEAPTLGDSSDDQLNESVDLNQCLSTKVQHFQSPKQFNETISINQTTSTTVTNVSNQLNETIALDKSSTVENIVETPNETITINQTTVSNQLNETIVFDKTVENIVRTPKETIALNQTSSPKVENDLFQVSNQLNETIILNQTAENNFQITNQLNQTIGLNQVAAPRVENDICLVSNQLNETIGLNQIATSGIIQISNKLNETIERNQNPSQTIENHIVSKQLNETIESPRTEHSLQLHGTEVDQNSKSLNETYIPVVDDNIVQSPNANQFNDTDTNTIIQSSFSNRTIDFNLSKVCADSCNAQNTEVHGAFQLNETRNVENNTALLELENNVVANQNTDLLHEIPLNSIATIEPLEHLGNTAEQVRPNEDLIESFSTSAHDEIEKQLDKIKSAALSKLQAEKQLSRVKLEKDITNSLSLSVHDQIEKQLNEINLNQTNAEQVTIVQQKPESNQLDKQSHETQFRDHFVFDNKIVLDKINVGNQINRKSETIEHNIQNQQSNESKQSVSTSSLTIHSLEDISAPLCENIDQQSYMSETTSKPSSHLCESNVASRLSIESNATSTHNIGEVIKQNDCFDKQTDIVNGAGDCKGVSIDNNKTLEDKSFVHKDMMERLTNAETECEKCKIQIIELKKELKVCRQKVVSRESELADLTRRENELTILVEDYKNKKANDCADSKEGGNELLRVNETALKNEIQELKELVKQLENNLRDMQRKEAKLSDDLNDKTQTQMQISRVMEAYEKSISSLVADNEKKKNERDTAQMHLANIEMAFSDVHQKYERCKTIIQSFKENEESLKQDISTNEDTILKQEQKYEALKAHAMAQLEKSNQELAEIKRHHDQELARVTAQLKRYEIKNNSLMEALTQKSKECEQLSAVCDEFIGNV